MIFFKKYKKLFLTAIIAIGIIGYFYSFGLIQAKVDAGGGGGGNAAPQEPSPEVQQGAWGLTVLTWIGKLASSLLVLIASLLNFAMSLGSNIMQLIAVQTGWRLVLSFTNLGFVLAIIVIAFATIFRISGYQTKQVLWKLIVAALLVNFSLVICGGIISFSNDLSNFFLKATTTTDLANALGNAFQPQQLILSSSDNFSGGALAFLNVKKFFLNILYAIISLIFGIIFTGLIILVFLTLFLMFLARSIILALLVILSPIVWLLWVFPSTSGEWKRWWHQFIRWNTFGPIAIFFVYLTVLTAKNLGDLSSIKGASGSDAAQAVIKQSFSGNNVVQLLAGLVLLLGILVGGLYVANRTGIVGGNIGINLAKGASKRFGGWVGNRTRQGGRLIGDRIRTAGRRVDATTGETTTALQRWGSGLQKVPGLRGVGSFVSRQGTGIPKARKEEIEAYRTKQLESLSNEGLIDRVSGKQAHPFIDPTIAAALGQELARRNLTTDPRISPLMDKFVRVSEKMGNAQTIYNSRPDLVQLKPGETIEQGIGRVMRGVKPADVIQLSHKAVGVWDNPNIVPQKEQISVAINLSNAQLAKLGAEGNQQQTEAIRNTIRKTLDDLTSGAPTLTLSSAEQAQLKRVDNYISKNPLWQT